MYKRQDNAGTIYLRPENAQGEYVNFLNVLRTMRTKLPFSIGQIGKAFRNEITPGNFTFRTIEFEQMEYQTFCRQGEHVYKRQGEWREKEEILRLDNQIREELGYPRRADAYAQPWIYGKQEYEHRVSLRFHINSEIDITDVRLALENADITEVFWNNRKIEDPAEGYYVDKQIRTVKLDGVKAGGNILEVHIPYHALSLIHICFR